MRVLTTSGFTSSLWRRKSRRCRFRARSGLWQTLVDEIRIRGGADPDEIVSALTEALGREFAASGRMQRQAILFDTSRR
jgi:hypothetical protein